MTNQIEEINESIFLKVKERIFLKEFRNLIKAVESLSNEVAKINKENTEIKQELSGFAETIISSLSNIEAFQQDITLNTSAMKLATKQQLTTITEKLDEICEAIDSLKP